MQCHKARLCFDLARKVLYARKMTAVVDSISLGFSQEKVVNGDSGQESRFHNVDNFTIHTGNISHWSSLKRKSTQSPQTELQDSLIKTLNACGTSCENQAKNLCSDNGNHIKGKRRLTCVNEKGIERVAEDQRPLMKVTAKIFAHQINVSHVKDAINETLAELGTNYFDVVFLALPFLDEESQISFMDIAKPYWMEMEKLHRSGTALNIATCDLDRPKLEELVSWAEIKPEVNQVNLTSCCHMPEELVKYAKEKDILLHTHGDPPVILPEENLEEIIGTLSEVDKNGWQANWVVRYSVIVKCRGVIKNKGYITSLARNLGAQKGESTNGESTNGVATNGSESNGNGVDH